jgi:hypothetical protein
LAVIAYHVQTLHGALLSRTVNIGEFSNFALVSPFQNDDSIASNKIWETSGVGIHGQSFLDGQLLSLYPHGADCAIGLLLKADIPPRGDWAQFPVFSSCKSSSLYITGNVTLDVSLVLALPLALRGNIFVLLTGKPSSSLCLSESRTPNNFLHCGLVAEGIEGVRFSVS